MPRIKKLIVEKVLSDDEIKSLKGTFIDESYMKYPLIQKNIDVYYKDENGEEKLLLKFRKNVLTDNEIRLGWKSYKDLAKPSRGRGASAGPVDPNNAYWKKRKLHATSKWSTSYLKPDGTPSKMRVNNQVFSTPIGYYADMKNMNSDLPCRLTHFARTNFEKYNEGIPFIQKIDSLYKKLIPNCHCKQHERANKKPHLKIPKTSFSTVTINRNFRTALHQDAGDYSEGFGNLTVIERGKYHGGYTILPQFGVAVDVRNNDFLAMDVHQWHSNTEIYETDEDKKYNESIPKSYNDNIEVGTAGIDKLYTRLTFVCYLRENLIDCPDEINSAYLTKSGHSKIKI
jgi:hypothetical protein